MHAFLIVGGDAEKRKGEAARLIGSEKVADDVNSRLVLGEPVGEKISPIGIDAVREIEKWLLQAANYPRSVLVWEAQNLTGPAANAMLKILEEPIGKDESQFRAIIVLTADSEQSLLATIRSRVKAVRLVGLDKKYYDTKNVFDEFPQGQTAAKKILWLYKTLSDLSGKKISPHGGAISRETGILLIEKLVETTTREKNAVKILSEAAKAHARLKQKVSPMLALQEFMLNI